MKNTTLKRIKEHEPCPDGWKKLLTHLGKTKADDEVLPFSVIVESNGLDDALWCCQVEPQYDKEWRLFAVWCARQVQHLMTDQRSIDALDVAERFAAGEATEEELADARRAAEAAVGAAWAAARAAWAAYAVWDAEAAWAACDAARAAWAASDASYAAWASASHAASNAAASDAGAAQTKEFLRVVS